MKNVILWVSATLTLLLGASCSSTKPSRELRISVADQKIALLEDGKVKRVYGCSTSKFGVGDRRNSYATPLGTMVVASKIGHGAPAGAVFKGRRATGEVLPPNAPGRDPITSRIMHLAGRESGNRGAYARCIYIHGTPEESRIGQPASFGCIRMRNYDVIDLFDKVAPGTPVVVTTKGLPLAAKLKPEFVANSRTFTRPVTMPQQYMPNGSAQAMAAR